MNEKEELKKQYFNNYKSNVIETIKNNSEFLCLEDIKSLFVEPPLSSMDIIKSYFLDSAKSYGLVINSDKLDDILNKYRNDMIEYCFIIKEIRYNYLIDYINDEYSDKDKFVYKLYKKSFIELDKNIKKSFNKKLSSSINDNICDLIYTILNCDNIDTYNKFYNSAVDYLNNGYINKIENSINHKINVKNIMLINNLHDINKRYLFTYNKSYLFKDSDIDDN